MTARPRSDEALVACLLEAAEAARQALERTEDWGPTGTVPGQYRCDLAADAAVTEVLHRWGLGVFSEESGRSGSDADIVVVVDPVDGSTNAWRNIPWYATSLCALDRDGPRAAVVVDHPRRSRYSAIRGAGAYRDGSPIAPSSTTQLIDAIVAVTGFPSRHLGWGQFRALGASALELCAVAEGMIDAFVVPPTSRIFPWDYLGALLVCREAGAVVEDLDDEELVLAERTPRHPVAAGTKELLTSLIGALR